MILAQMTMAVEVPTSGNTGTNDIWRSSKRFTPDYSSSFAWRKRLGVIRSGEDFFVLGDGTMIKMDEARRVNGISVYNLQKIDIK